MLENELKSVNSQEISYLHRINDLECRIQLNEHQINILKQVFFIDLFV